MTYLRFLYGEEFLECPDGYEFMAFDPDGYAPWQSIGDDLEKVTASFEKARIKLYNALSRIADLEDALAEKELHSRWPKQ